MTTKQNIKRYSRKELEELMQSIGEPRFRAAQLHRWLYSDRASDFHEMTTISKSLRETLDRKYFLPQCSMSSTQCVEDSSADSTTRKFLVQLHDQEAVETVLIPAEGRNTVCVSTQVGCPLHCSFCATGYMGFTRNLNAAEIAEQVFLVQDYLDAIGCEAVTNIVYMGMGEPLLALEEVIESVGILSDTTYRLHISQKKITLSTVGLLPEIGMLARSGLTTNLAISLHSADQETRASLMPSARDYPLKELRKTLIQYTSETGQPVTLVYMLLKEINDTQEDALKLVRLARSFLCKINLIDYNPIVNIKFDSAGEQRKNIFIRTLVDAGLNVTVRKSHGSSINAACGQLAINKKLPESSTL